MGTHNIGFGRELLDLECHHFLLSGALNMTLKLRFDLITVKNILEKGENVGSKNVSVEVVRSQDSVV